jgi:hypothetical protein
MRRHQNALVPLDRRDGDLLEGIEGEGPRARRLSGGLVLGDGDIVVVGREGDLMADLMREHHGLSLLLRLCLEPCSCSEFARLLRLEIVRHNRLGLGIALLPLQSLRCAIRAFVPVLVLVLVLVLVFVRTCGCLGGIRHGRILRYRRLHIAVGLALLALLGRRVLCRASLEDIKHVVVHDGDCFTGLPHRGVSLCCGICAVLETRDGVIVW